MEKKTNIAPENRPGPKRKQSSSNYPFSGAKILVSGRVNVKDYGSRKLVLPEVFFLSVKLF